MGSRLLALLLGLLLAAPPAAPPPAPPGAYEANSRGVALLNRGEAASALTAFQAARQAAPRWSTPRVNEAIALVVLGRYADALPIFDEVLAQEPDNLRALFNRGLARKRTAAAGAEEDFARVSALDPDDPDALYQLGTARMDRRDFKGASEAFTKLLEKDLWYLSAYFALGRALLMQGEREKAQVYLTRFEELKKTSPMASTVGQAYGEQGVYSLAEDATPPPPPAPPSIPVAFVDVAKAWGLGTGDWGPAEGIGLVDLDGAGAPELVVPTASGVRLFRNADAGFHEQPRLLSGVACHGLAAGDVDKDGDADLLVSTARGAALLRNDGGLRFTDITKAAGLEEPTPGRGVLFVDADHDGDLDLVVAREAGPRLVRNNGDGTFKDVTTEAGIAGAGPALGLVAIDLEGDRDVDLVVTGPEAYALLNQRDGTFRKQAPWPEPVREARGVALPDLDGDGQPDLVFTRQSGAPVALRGHARLRLAPLPLPDPQAAAGPGVADLDLDNDGLTDLVLAGPEGLRLLRGLGAGALADVTAAVGLKDVKGRCGGVAVADIDGDGDLDLAVARANGPPLVLRNDGGNARAWLAIDARGLNDNKTGVGTRIEVRAGGRFQRTDVLGGGGYLSQSALTRHLGLGDAKTASVRLLWPTGVLQDELEVKGTQVARIEELDRKGSSCPVLYAWDGAHMRFQADMIGAGVMGQWAGPGQRNVSDPDEYLLVEGAVPRDGRYHFALVEQMEEVTYLDAVRLLVVDHPRGVRIFPNERFTGAPPFPEFKLIRAAAPRPLRAATDQAGRDVLPLLRDADGRYLRFERTDLVGFAEPHHVVLDLGPRQPGERLRFLMRGYTEYFYPRTLFTAAQRGLAPEPPVLEAWREGRWEKVADVGIPAGLPRWMVLDPGQGLDPEDRVLRLRSNMEVYWDQILLDGGRDEEPVSVRALQADAAALEFHGFPQPRGRDPETYEYEGALPTGPYARAAGRYTRYGPVEELTREVDDRFVVMGPGDAVELSFDARGLPPLPQGWARSLVFFAHGYEKDMDDYTAELLTVEPLPFRAMSSYPYPPGESYPDDPAHLDYRLRYNTRVVGRSGWTTPAAGPKP
ncbi:MAG TPA: FG-GAP-like repeat-containing protein [Vicinamibacteria bacterium]